MKTLFLWAAPLISLSVIYFVELTPGSPQVTAAAAIALWMAIWWISEAVPLAVTALLPVILFPLFGIMTGKATTSHYCNSIVFLFVGGFLVALAMQRWGLHKRIALRILASFGGHPALLLLGFMLATAFLSMWISNTATAMLMVPIVLAVILNLESQFGEDKVHRYSIGLLLSIAYSASIGGIATLIGTPPNLSFSRIFAISFPDIPGISFANWFFFAIPLTVILLLIAWGLLVLLFSPKKNNLQLDREYFIQTYRQLGPASSEEKTIFVVFSMMALLWVFRSDISAGSFIIPGWSNLLPYPKFIDDGTIAIAMAALLFLFPSKNKKGERLLDNHVFSELPWHIILLFGGGFALASGFIESGLSSYLAQQLTHLKDTPLVTMIATITLLVTFLTELTSNTATTEMLLPVLAALSVATDVNPLFLMIPATLSASLAFMLPVATPPNAIIFGTNKVRVIEMAKTGILLNLAGAIIVTLGVYFWAGLALGANP